MSRLFVFASLATVVAGGLMLTGCSNRSSNQSASGQPSVLQDATANGGHAHREGEDHAGGMLAGHDASEPAAHADQASQSQYAEALAALSPEERALAAKQKVCPVSGEPLGSMGTPLKITVKGQDVLLCCSGCESKIKEDPDKYLAKLPK